MPDAVFRSWQRWLLAASAFVCAFSVMVAVFPNALFLDRWNAAIASSLYDGAETEYAPQFRGFVRGLLGATMAGSYLLQAFVAAIPYARREVWAW